MRLRSTVTLDDFFFVTSLDILEGVRFALEHQSLAMRVPLTGLLKAIGYVDRVIFLIRPVAQLGTD